MTDLEPNEALILFIRKSDATPARYVAGIRKADAYFSSITHDLSLSDLQESLWASEKFDSLDAAIDASGAKLKSLCGNAATA